MGWCLPVGGWQQKGNAPFACINTRIIRPLCTGVAFCFVGWSSAVPNYTIEVLRSCAAGVCWMRRNWIVLIVIVAVVLLLDQMTKYLVLENLQLYESVSPIPLLAPFFQLTRTENTGAAFGFLPQVGDLFLLIAFVVVLAMFYFYPRVHTWPTRFAIGMICGGALGNALDRIQHGLVVDFIHYQIPGIVSNVSNLADHAIVLGVLIVFADSWRRDAQQDVVPEAEAAARDENATE